MSTSGVLVRAAATRFLPDLMQKSPCGDPTIDFSLLGRQLYWCISPNLLLSSRITWPVSASLKHQDGPRMQVMAS